MNPLLLIMIIATVATSACAKPVLSDAHNGQDDAAVTAAPIHFFRTYLSGADGHRCPMSPSCSRYALTAIERHGPFMGWIMTFDRLMRCGRDELTVCPAVMTQNGPRCRDTVENNDFWWN